LQAEEQELELREIGKEKQGNILAAKPYQ